MAFTPNLVIGVLITLVGSLLVLDRLGLVEFRAALQLWPVLLTLFGVSVIVHALRGGSTEDGSPHNQRPIIGPGLVLFLVLVGFLGWRSSERRATGDSEPASQVSASLVGIFSEDSRASANPAFEGADMLSVMGATRLDLRKAGLAHGREVVIDVVGVMGGVEIFVPRDWTVDVRTVTIMGNVKDQRLAPANNAGATDESTVAATAPKLIVKGIVLMGGLVIKS